MRDMICSHFLAEDTFVSADATFDIEMPLIIAAGIYGVPTTRI